MTTAHQVLPPALISSAIDATAVVTGRDSKFNRWTRNAAVSTQPAAAMGPAEEYGTSTIFRNRKLQSQTQCTSSSAVSVSFDTVMGGDTGAAPLSGSFSGVNSGSTTPQSLTPNNPAVCFSTVSTPTSTGGGGSAAQSSTSSGLSSCFASSEQVTLESGATKAMVDVKVGDRILTLNAQGEQVFSDVVYLPHGRNEEHATFAQITTESGHDLKMTMDHFLPAGTCALTTLPLVAAGQITVGDCVQTLSGREQVLFVDKIEGKGIYTIIAMEELIVVNGIVATPYGGINPTLVNIYYNLHRLAYTAFAGKMVDYTWLQKVTEGVWSVLSDLSAQSA